MGELDELVDALMADERARQLAGDGGRHRVTRRELTDELTVRLGGSRHDARFIVDEVLGSGGVRPAEPCPNQVRTEAVGRARYGGPPGRGGAVAIRLRALVVPRPRPPRRPPCADPASRERTGRGGGAGRGPAPAPAWAWRPWRPWLPRFCRRRCRYRQRRHRTRPGRRASVRASCTKCGPPTPVATLSR